MLADPYEQHAKPGVSLDDMVGRFKI